MWGAGGGGEGSREVIGSNSLDSEPSCPVASAGAKMKRAKLGRSQAFYSTKFNRGEAKESRISGRVSYPVNGHLGKVSQVKAERQ